MLLHVAIRVNCAIPTSLSRPQFGKANMTSDSS